MDNKENKKPFTSTKTFAVLLIFFVLILSVAFNSNKEENIIDINAEYPKTTTKELFDAYNENAIRADEKYKDKIYEISGTIKSIDNTLGKNIVRLNNNVECYFDNKEDIIDLNKGDNITIIGKIDGQLIYIDVYKCIIK